MIDYQAKLKELRFNFRSEEIIDYQTLIALVANLLQDEKAYNENKEELFHTSQILVLVYGVEDYLTNIGYNFDLNNFDVNDLNVWKYLLVRVYEDLEKTNDFVISNETINIIYRVLNDLSFSVLPEEEVFYSEESKPTEDKNKEEEENTPYKFIEPNADEFHFMNENINIGEFNPDYLKEYIVRKNLKPYKCACCGLEEWQGKPLPLKLSFLHKKDMMALEDVMFLCPNCYSQIGK